MATNFTLNAISSIRLKEQDYHLKNIAFHGTAAEWENHADYVPKAGEIVIYDADSTNELRIKIGDGTTTVSALSFSLDNQVQSDWNQNDESAADYIKNRTHYDNGLINMDLVPVQEVSGFNGDEVKSTDNPFVLELVEGKTYTVNWDGTEYELVCEQVIEGVFCIGNPNLAIFETNSGDFPFGIGVDITGYVLVATNLAGSSHQIGISTIVPDVKQLDMKYLPIVEVLDSTLFSETVTGDMTFNNSEYKQLIGQYEVIVDGTSYIGYFQDIEGTSVFEVEGIIKIFNDMGRVRVIIESDEQAHEVQIKSIEQLAKIKEKYLPDSIINKPGRMVEGEQFTYSVDGETTTTGMASIGTEIFNDLNDNVAIGKYSHAEGRATYAIGDYSHTEGRGTEAIGDYSHAEGYRTAARSSYQHVQGKYNIADANEVYAHIIGNGTSSSVPSNAHTVDWNGNAWYAGNLYLGGTGMDDATIKGIIVHNSTSTLPDVVNGAILIAYDE